MSSETLKATAELDVHEAFNQWLKAARAKDIDGIVARYADDVIAYDAILQLQFKGIQAYGQHWRYCMEMCSGDHIFEPADPTIHADGNVAFLHCLIRCGGEHDGQVQTSWMRGTQCYVKRGGQWKIIHEHFSAPFDMETTKALFDLQP
ncbi:nuclear transport factor 2 family protein [Pseudomonas sp. LFM046]|uniref:YybH family protein n=1 Tax=Pseudomonas sp. LFM046 TaxID=1608357 RepID=UPI0005CFBB87|nr:nuclear transport factor 2 family protein [Pseudomonas sp. LFM046]